MKVAAKITIKLAMLHNGTNKKTIEPSVGTIFRTQLVITNCFQMSGDYMFLKIYLQGTAFLKHKKVTSMFNVQ